MHKLHAKDENASLRVYGYRVDRNLSNFITSLQRKEKKPSDLLSFLVHNRNCLIRQQFRGHSLCSDPILPPSGSILYINFFPASLTYN